MTNQDTEKRRLFFGMEVLAPWPMDYPKGRLLMEQDRHMTLLFLGDVSYSKVNALLSQLPKPPQCLGAVGKLNSLLFLPPRRPRVVACDVEWLDNPDPFLHYQKELSDLFKTNGFTIDEREFLAHVTLCRAPFHRTAWENWWKPLPCVIKNINLYESQSQLRYIPLWNIPLHAPFEEIEHTADIAYKIYGGNLPQLFLHAQIALAFRDPAMLPYISQRNDLASLYDLIVLLNDYVSRVDSEIGTSFKAVSFHGELQSTPENLLQWEMIVDV